jgi:hypothetical protein
MSLHYVVSGNTTSPRRRHIMDTTTGRVLCDLASYQGRSWIPALNSPKLVCATCLIQQKQKMTNEWEFRAVRANIIEEEIMECPVRGDLIRVSYSGTYRGDCAVLDSGGTFRSFPADATVEVIVTQVYANSPTRKIEPGDIIRTSTGVVCARTHQEEWYRLDSMTKLNLPPGVIRNATLLIRHRQVVTQ